VGLGDVVGGAVWVALGDVVGGRFVPDGAGPDEPVGELARVDGEG
jgi:hypothetical protein